MDISNEEKRGLREFEKRIRYRFRRRFHLKRALTHKSYANEHQLGPEDHNERYEYLGDAVLELAISHLLMDRFPKHAEGELSKLRAAIVNEAELARIARKLELGNFLYVGKGEEQTGGRDKPSLLSDALEAVFCAIYLDRDFLQGKKVIAHLYDEMLETIGGLGFMKDYKTRLQEETQSRFHAIPRYRLVGETGPDHQKIFEVSLSVQGKILSIGKGGSKKAAEQDAAKRALLELGCEISVDDL